MNVWNVFSFAISRALNFIFYLMSFIYWSSEKENHNNIAFLTNYKFKLRNKKEIKHIEANKLRCCTWNIHHGYDSSWRFVLPQIIQYLNEMDFDIIFLQEVNNSKYNINNNSTNISEYIGSILNMEVSSIDELTILSKFPIDTTRYTNYYTNNNYSFGNHMLTCKIKYTDNDEIVCVNIHLNNDFIGYEQHEAIKKLELNKLILSHKENNTKLLVCGDFNAPRSFSVNSEISQLFSQKDKNNAITYPTYYPFFCLDKVWLNETNTNQTIANIYSDNSNYYSDHIPLLFEIKLNHSISIPVLTS